MYVYIYENHTQAHNSRTPQTPPHHAPRTIHTPPHPTHTNGAKDGAQNVIIQKTADYLEIAEVETSYGNAFAWSYLEQPLKFTRIPHRWTHNRNAAAVASDRHIRKHAP